jgi:hypothetical protein
MELQIREKEIFETLKRLRHLDFVLIGGYAVNAYALPRFSVDCDLVVKTKEEAEKIEKELLKLGYLENKDTEKVPKVNYHGNFKRYEKKIGMGFLVSMDLLIHEVSERQTKSIFSAEWVFENSKIRILRGKTIVEELKLRIINIDALFAMKMSSCRLTDIRDIFILVSNIENKKWIKEEISKRYSFEDRFEKVKKVILSKQFKDSLQGVFGLIDNKIFERNKKLILDLSSI